MLHKIAPFYDQKNMCIENIYISVCNALDRNYKDIYAYSWNFGYMPYYGLPGMELFGKRISPGRDGQGVNSDQISAMEMCCGILPMWHINCRFDGFMDIVKRELANNRAVAVGTDIFFCNWHKAYNKYHSVHYCLIVGINEAGFICIDDILASTDGSLVLPERPQNIMLDFDNLKRFNFGFVIFRVGPYESKYSSDEIVYISALRTLTGYNGKSDFNNMRNLLTDINKYLDIDKEIAGFEDAWAIDLVRCFNYIIWNRNNYCMFINDKQKYRGGDVGSISDKLMSSMNLWNGIKNYIMKYAVDPGTKFNKDLICDSLNEIITIEENLANEIVNAY